MKRKDSLWGACDWQGRGPRTESQVFRHGGVGQQEGGRKESRGGASWNQDMDNFPKDKDSGNHSSEGASGVEVGSEGSFRAGKPQRVMC